MADHIAVIEYQYARLPATGTVVYDAMKVAIIKATLRDHREHEAIMTFIKTMREEHARWPHISKFLLEEGKRLQATTGSD